MHKMNNKIHGMIVVSAMCLWLVAATGNAAILSRLEQGQSLTISAIGTSLTAEKTNFGDGLWFNKLGTWLNTKYPGKVTLDNEAYGGACSQTTAGTYARNGLSAQDGGPGQLALALAHSPDAIFIEFGMNDCVTHFGDMTQSVGITTTMLRNNLQTMIDQIKTWSVKHEKSVDIILLTMNDEPGSDRRKNLPDYYETCRDAAKANGLLLIDNYPDWVKLHADQPSTWQSYVTDGVHPNEAGTNAIIMPNVQKALLSQVPEPNSKVLLSAGAISLLACNWRKCIFADKWLHRRVRSSRRLTRP